MHEDTPVLLASLGWGEGQPIPVDEVFGTTPRQTVSFEIAFTAFLATVILSAPSTGTFLDLAGEFSAILLLMVTLTRRMAIDNPWLDLDPLMHRTTRYILYLTFIGVTYVGFSIAGLLSTVFPINIYVIASLLIFGISFAVAITYELLYMDLFLWIAIGFYNYQLDKPNTNHFYNGLLGVARWILEHSYHNYNPENLIIERIYQRDLNRAPGEISRLPLAIFIILTVILLVVFVVLALPLTLVITGSLIWAVIVLVAMFFATIPLSALVQFVYARYGNTSFEQATASLHLLWLLPIVYILLLLHAEPDMISILSDLLRGLIV